MKNFIKKFIPSFLLDSYHFILALLGAVFYCFPSRKIKVIGITGTDGKSTVVELISKILEEANFKVASLSSIQFKIDQRIWPNTLKMTMPGRFQLQKFLSQAVNSGCQYAVLEVSSEGIKQHRHRFIDFEVAVFTNLTPEHIEAHGSFEKYREAKGKLFKKTKLIHIINLDDENTEYFLKIPSQQKFCYSINNHFKIESLKIDWKLEIGNWKFIKALNINISTKGIDFAIGNVQFHLNLLGGFNVYNALAAVCLGLSQGIDLEICQEALEKIKGIPGRLEEVISEPFKVFVDYAVTPDALQKVYKTLSGISNFQFPISKQILNSKFQKPKLICVLGACGGGRDKWKRPVLGEIAVKYCDEIIITNEDPYDEDPMEIMDQIEEGIRKQELGKKYWKILDRREAIKKALTLAKANDLVIITGKGCEPWMCVKGGKKIPWDDREIVKEEYERLQK